MAECFPFWTAFNKTTELDFCLSGNPWDIATATYDNVSYDLTTVGVQGVREIFFRPDGAALYVLSNLANGVPDAVSEYTLSAPWDISTLAYSGADYSVSNENTSPGALFFRPDGAKMYVGGGDDVIYQYTLSTPWNVTSATYDSVNHSVSGEAPTATDVFFGSDGAKMYVLDFNSAIVFQYTLAVAWDLSTASYDSISFSLRLGAAETFFTGLFFKPDGTRLYGVDNSNDSIHQYTLTTAWDLSSAAYDNASLDVSSEEIFIGELGFKTDGTKMYLLGTKLNQYTL